MLSNMFEYETDPVLVEVSENGYEVFSFSSIPTRRDLWLMSLIREMGGIGENVEAGKHFFTATRIGPSDIKVTLDKII